MADYNKTQSPPEGEPYLETADGLKFWLGSRKFKPGLKRIVETEDASITMEAYGGGHREEYGSYLFRFKDFQIGFVCHEFMNGYPAPPKPVVKDLEKQTFTKTITGIGTPVNNPEAGAVLDENGDIKKRRGLPVLNRSGSPNSHYITGLTWHDFAHGKSDKFRSRLQQEEMLAIWQDLFEGMLGKLTQLRRPQEKRGLSAVAQFSDVVREQLKSGSLIEE